MPQTEHFNFSIVNITESATPEVKITRNNKWVEYGENNDYFEHIIDLYNNSSIHKSLVDGICRRIYGRGLASDSGSPVEFAKARKLFNTYEVSKFILDFKLQGNAAFKVVTNKVGIPIKFIHQPIETIRPAVCNEDGEIEGYWYSADWKESRRREYKPEYIDAYNPEITKAGEFIAYLKEYSPSSFYFGKPDYVGATKWIECDIEISLYHLSNIKSGFSGATLIQLFNGQPTPQRREELERLFKNKFSGSQGQKIVFMYHNDREEMAEVKNAPIPEADKQYEFLANETRQQIMVGHRITSPMLLGIRQETGLGNNADEIEQAENLFNKVVIKPYQTILEDFINELAASAGLSVRLYFQSLDLIENKKTDNELLRKVELSEPKVIEDKFVDPILEYLEDEGEDEQDLLGEGFELFDEEDLDGDDFLEVVNGAENLESIKMLDAWGLTPNNPSKYDVKAPDGSGMWLVRYQYALARQNAGEPDIIATSRKFCTQMIDAAKNGNRVYKREVLEKLSNPEFGSYEIFWYKGSYNCRHVWKRKLYFKTFGTKDKPVPVGNVPYVVSRVNDKRATTKNKKPKRR